MVLLVVFILFGLGKIIQKTESSSGIDRMDCEDSTVIVKKKRSMYHRSKSKSKSKIIKHMHNAHLGDLFAVALSKLHQVFDSFELGTQRLEHVVHRCQYLKQTWKYYPIFSNLTLLSC
jgi:hypothetical protein